MYDNIFKEFYGIMKRNIYIKYLIVYKNTRMTKIIGSTIFLQRKLNTPYVTTGQFICVESKQLCRDINTSLEIKEKILLTT
jgi:hypothetical protein